MSKVMRNQEFKPRFEPGIASELSSQNCALKSESRGRMKTYEIITKVNVNKEEN
jgi:hypothetical protein